MYSNYTYIDHCFKDQRIVSNLHHWEIRNDKDLQVRVMNGEFHIVFIGPELLLTNPLWRQMVRLPTYMTIFLAQGHECTEPVGAPNRARFRLVDMYSSVTQKEVQESIIKSFSCSKAPLRVLICNIAFGMGLACVDVTQIIHWGPASDVESYMQELIWEGRTQWSAVKCSIM